MLPTVRIDRTDTVRLISNARKRAPVLNALADTHGDIEDLSVLEGATNDRLMAQSSGLQDLDHRELSYGVPNHTFVNAAFTHTRPGGSRFNDGSRGAWYCSFEIETAIAEITYHLTRELRAIGRFDNTTDYCELFAELHDEFHDLRPSDPATFLPLNPDAGIAYPAGQELARTLRAAHGSNGIVYPSLRRDGGTCIAVFKPALVQNVRQGGIWRLEWQGAPEPVVTNI